MRQRESLCWTCVNGRADRCAWVAAGIRVWQKARDGARGMGAEPMKVVEECVSYEPRPKKQKGAAAS